MRSLVRAAWRAFTVQLKLRVVNPLSYFQVVAQPMIFGGVALVLYATSGQGARIPLAVVGGGLVGLWSVTLFNSGFDITSERWTGTLEEIFACPTPLAVIVFGKVASSMVLGTLSFVLNLALAYAFFGRAFERIEPLPLAASFALTIAACYSMGMLFAPFFAWSRATGSLLNTFETPVYLLCGFMFPITFLPAWAQPFSWFLAPTWTVRGMFAATGQPVGDHHYALWWAAALGLMAVYAVLTAMLYRLVDRKARMSGELATV